MKTILAALLVVTFQLPAFTTPPSDCEVTAADHDDGSRYAYCADGTYYFDPDGQRWANSAGVPVRVPGWYREG